MSQRRKHLKAVTVEQPQLAIGISSLQLFLLQAAELIATIAVRQRQSPWKTAFPQLTIIFGDDDGGDGGDGGVF